MSDEVLLKSVSFVIRSNPLKVYLESTTVVGEEQLALARHVEACLNAGSLRLQDKRVLHVMAGGSGLAGILASLCGAHVVLTDASLSPSLRFNADENLPIKRCFCVPSADSGTAPVGVGSITLLPLGRKQLRSGCGSAGYDVILVSVGDKTEAGLLLDVLVRGPRCTFLMTLS